ncbi:MAG: hypothetical protein HWE39_22260 [Oceanospirillaceae bacterium]|nr:hypothetical protein [Oceanospirillaceae bacterium]
MKTSVLLGFATLVAAAALATANQALKPSPAQPLTLAPHEIQSDDSSEPSDSAATKPTSRRISSAPDDASEPSTASRDNAPRELMTETGKKG